MKSEAVVTEVHLGVACSTAY